MGALSGPAPGDDRRRDLGRPPRPARRGCLDSFRGGISEGPVASFCRDQQICMTSPLEPSVSVDKPWVLSRKMLRVWQVPAGAIAPFDAAGMSSSALFVKREHGLALLSPYRPSLILGVEQLVDAFFVPGRRRGSRRGTNSSNPPPSSEESCEPRFL